jgi:hypothetical protein
MSVRRIRWSTLSTAFAVAALSATPAPAQDVDARTMAFLHDLASPQAQLPPGTDPAAMEAVRRTLRSERLLTDQRVATVEAGVVDQYARALLLGNRGPQFVEQIGKVRDAVLRRDQNEIEQAIGDLYQAAGRQRPTGEALKRLVAGVGGAAAAEGPAQSVRQRFEKSDHVVEITEARRAGLLIAEVTTKDANGQPVRTVMVGEQSARPNARGNDLEQRVVPKTVCTVNQTQAAAMRPRLNGDWTDGEGKNWRIEGTGDQIVLRSTGGQGSTLTYEGTFRLGRIEGRHAIRNASDVEASLPGWVRSGLARWSPTLYFVVRLDACANAETLSGTWQSQHVTYSPSFQTISKVHDPYELRLTLKRAAPMRGLAALP